MTNRMLPLAAGAAPAYLSLPAGGSGPGILALHAWWGLNPFFKTLCDRLAAAGFVVLAPDLFDGQVAVTIEDAQRQARGADDEHTKARVLAGLDALLAQPGVRPGGVGAIGFSFGAAWASYLTELRPADIQAVVLFYGSYAVNFSAAHAAYLGHFAENDAYEPPESEQEMQAALKAAGRPVDFYTYPGTSHWFMEENRPEYVPEAAQLAWQRTLTFLHQQLA